ncbi:hypothetical protein [Streptomyces sp. CT34]|uniref:hypothetical protein n=1 Tax=Streptomyces sp. CT34 TaxID=1553907 RepID=UPI0005BDFE5C|nr:hypothetical protein [Streptomyces sp. CT34]
MVGELPGQLVKQPERLVAHRDVVVLLAERFRVVEELVDQGVAGVHERAGGELRARAINVGLLFVINALAEGFELECFEPRRQCPYLDPRLLHLGLAEADRHSRRYRLGVPGRAFRRITGGAFGPSAASRFCCATSGWSSTSYFSTRHSARS